ncbi:hypothetical protein [Actibacterium ureilyticum]|uniref:hypothetical protein n=1 Tax=Actibacterium ureilyticum TaxID=1590614 RepID=UPI0011410733|nr:hypothetical protein [Actibacterium ureilyticum]
MKRSLICLSAALLAAGCAQNRIANLATCTAEAGITGTYSTVYTMDGGTAIVPGPDVTEDQARIANACLRRLGSARTPVRPRGTASIPSEYPLQPGDAQLWQSLTPEQQRRALDFLRDGSTIRSSLQPD